MSVGRKILFTPLGITDPMKNLYDGSMLHIIRKIHPDEVHMFMSKEIYEIAEKSKNGDGIDQYSWCVQALAENIGKEIKIVKHEEKEFVDAHSYERCHQYFENYLKDLHSTLGDNDTLYINIASGTPAMKATLYLLPNLMEHNQNIVIVQVGTPEKKSNSEGNLAQDASLEEQWELNEDNKPDHEDRSILLECKPLQKMIRINTIKKHLDAYDYGAALSIAEEIKTELSEKAFEMLQFANYRVNLDEDNMKILPQVYNKEFIPVNSSEMRRIFEYILILDLKRKRGEYADFIRALSPIFVNIATKILNYRCGIRIENFLGSKQEKQYGAKKKNTNKYSSGEWNIVQLSVGRNAKGDIDPVATEIFSYLQNEYNPFNGGFVSYEHLVKLIEHFLEEQTDIVEAAKKLRQIEKELRNTAAHEIASITDEKIVKICQINSEKIMDRIKFLASKMGYGFKPNEVWFSYEKMNEAIKVCLDT